MGLCSLYFLAIPQGCDCYTFQQYFVIFCDIASVLGWASVLVVYTNYVRRIRSQTEAGQPTTFHIHNNASKIRGFLMQLASQKYYSLIWLAG